MVAKGKWEIFQTRFHLHIIIQISKFRFPKNRGSCSRSSKHFNQLPTSAAFASGSGSCTTGSRARRARWRTEPQASRDSLDRRWQFPRKWLNFNCSIVPHRWPYGDWSDAKRLSCLTLVRSSSLISRTRTCKTRQTWIWWLNNLGGHPYTPPVISCQSCNLCANEGSKALTNFLSRPARRPLHNMVVYTEDKLGRLCGKANGTRKPPGV